MQFFKVQFGDTVLAFNPVSKDSKLKTTRFGADICLVSLRHEDFNGVEQIGFGEKQPFVVEGPGEYEVKGVFIKGFESHSSYDKKDRINTIYLVTLEGMNLCFLGGLDTKELPSEMIEVLGDIDILFAPISGAGMLSPADAYKVAVKLEPKVIIPMGADEAESKDALKTFLKEGGSAATPVDKYTVKKKDLEGKEGDIIVITPTL